MGGKLSKKELMLQEMQSLHKELLELKNRSDNMVNEEQKHEDTEKNYADIQNENEVLRAKLLEMESHLTNLSLSPESNQKNIDYPGNQSSVGNT